MLLLIMHVITPLNKAQRAVLFVIKLQIKADLEKEKTMFNEALVLFSWTLMLVSKLVIACDCIWALSLSMAPNYVQCCFSPSHFHFWFSLPARGLSLAACCYEAMRNIVPYNYKCSLSTGKQWTRMSSLEHVLSCCWPCWLFSFTMQEMCPVIYGSENYMCTRESAI